MRPIHSGVPRDKRDDQRPKKQSNHHKFVLKSLLIVTLDTWKRIGEFSGSGELSYFGRNLKRNFRELSTERSQNRRQKYQQSFETFLQ